MAIEFRGFQIRPYSNHLCWEVWERKPYKLPRKESDMGIGEELREAVKRASFTRWSIGRAAR